MKIGDAVKFERLKRDITARHLAEKSGLSKELIYKIESGEIKNVGLLSLQKISKGLGIKVYNLLKGVH